MPHLIRNPTECPFGWLKARWGLFLKCTIALQLENVPATIFSCFILHVCEMNQCGVDPNLVRKLAELHQQRKNIKNIPDPVYSITLEETKKARTILTKHIQDQLPDYLAEGF